MTALDRMLDQVRAQRRAAELSADIETDMSECQGLSGKALFQEICDRADNPDKYTGEAERLSQEIRALRESNNGRWT